jgi:hypothetical protein
VPFRLEKEHFAQMALMFHVTSSRNRESILANGLDWRMMGASPGIAGSRTPEQDGCFMCQTESEADWFVRMNNTGGPVDVWAVDGVDDRDLVESPEGYLYLPMTVPPDRLTLVRRDVPPQEDRWEAESRSATRSDGPGVDAGDMMVVRLTGWLQEIRLRGWRRVALRLLRPAPIRNVLGWLDCSVPVTRGRFRKLLEPIRWRHE